MGSQRKTICTLFAVILLFSSEAIAKKKFVPDWSEVSQKKAFFIQSDGPQWKRLPHNNAAMHEFIAFTFAFDPTNSDRIVLGTRPQGIYISEDRGRTWKKALRSPKTTKAVGANKYSIQFHEKLNNRLYVGYEKTGLYWSDDLFATKPQNVRVDNIVDITVHPEDPQVMYVGTDNGLYQSNNAGKSWKKVKGGLPQKRRPSCTVVEFDPQNPLIIYATYLDTALHLEAGFWMSKDGGKSWKASNQGIDPGTIAAKLAINGQGEKSKPVSFQKEKAETMAIDKNNPGTLYLGTESRGIYKSSNYGESWKAIHDVSIGMQACGAIAVHPKKSNLIFAASSAGVYRSDNAGKTWRLFSNGLRAGREPSGKEQYAMFRGQKILVTDRTTANEVTCLKVHPDGKQLFAACSSGLYVVEIK